MNAADIIRTLALLPHPEGGWYREMYRSEETVPAAGLPARYAAPRAIATSIYFLLEAGQFSAFHRLRSDEIWFHLAGGDLTVWQIDEAGALHEAAIGPDAKAWQLTIPRGRWFAARPSDGAPFTLIGCTVAPGFDFADFELARRGDLTARFPAHRSLIEQLTRS